jgi:DNA-binding GntR family transcriptional regulator
MRHSACRECRTYNDAVAQNAPDEAVTSLGLGPLVGLQDEPLVDSVYRVLRDAICDGRLEPNHKLAQIPLAEELGISRTPVRDALQRLAQEGLVRAPSWRGFVVSEFSARDAVDIYEVRLALEPLAARKAVGHHSRAQIAELLDNCEDTAAVTQADIAEIYELNQRFHRGIVEPCENQVLVRTLDQLWQMPASLRMFHAQAVHSHALERTAEEHSGIVHALVDGDAALVEELVRTHIAKARDETVAALDDHHV